MHKNDEEEGEVVCEDNTNKRDNNNNTENIRNGRVMKVKDINNNDIKHQIKKKSP